MGASQIDYRISLEETQTIKALAIMAMLFHHLFYLHPEYGLVTFVTANACKVCVALFVFLSGYGMAMTFPQKSKNKLKTNVLFLGKRYAKFFLNYWFVFAVVVPLGVFVFGRSLEDAYGGNANICHSLVLDILGRQEDHSYNVTWWFNSFITVLWIMFPLFYWMMKSHIVAPCALILFFVNPDDIMYPLHFVAMGLPSYILPFSLGIFCALRRDAISRFLNRCSPLFVLSFSCIATIILLYFRGVQFFVFFSRFRVDPFAVFFIILTIIGICRLTNRKFLFLQYVGRHAMNIYLVHTFIYSYFFADFIYGFKYPVFIFGVLFAITLLVSICFEFIKNQIGFYRLQNKIVGVFVRGLK